MAKAPKKPRKKAVNGYKMPEPLPQGETLTDITGKKSWKLGPFVGKGGFGEIYSAQDASAKSSKKFPYVIKVEPHENGPLFVEMHFYMKNAKPADIDEFRKKHKLKTFGMPEYLGSGSHEVGPNKYRFIVMEKFGTDIDKVRQENGGTLPVPVVFQLAWQMMYVLEYIHECEYIHADLKGANILMGITPENKNQAYLVDFGLATKFSKEKEYKPNPKKANDGTIEYLSRDAHQGVPTRRGDLEVLGYNLIHWLGGKLPWESCLSDVKAVQQGKEQAMKDVPKFVKTCFGSSKVKGIDCLVQFLKYVNTLEFNEEPNYKKIRDFFKKEAEANGAKVDGPLDFQVTRKRRSVSGVDTPEKKAKDNEETQGAVKKGRTGRRKKDEEDHAEDQEEIEKVVRKGRVGRKNKDKEEEMENDEKMSTDSTESAKAKIEIPTKNITNRRKPTKKEDNIKENGVEVMTAAMKEILARKNKNAKSKKTAVNGEASNADNEFEGYTDEMKEIKMKKMKNENKNKVNGDNIASRLRSGK